MTLEELRNSGHIIFECISGSRAYGLNTPTSDTDIRGVFVLPRENYYSLNYIGQVSNETNDIVFYELKKFIELCLNNNPNILELLNVPEHCIIEKNKIFDRIKMEQFLSKKCEQSFANYAFTQIKKARGLEKKIMNPIDKKRKSVLDFCYVLENGRSVALKTFLETKNIKQEECGLANIPHMKDCFNLYNETSKNYKGIIKGEDSNDITLSKIPINSKSIGMMFYNKDGYSIYCKKYKEYWDWVDKRNQARYNSTINHGKNYDSKNMMHTFRLLHMAKEIALEKKINVFRKDRELLLDIKQGKFEYEDLVNKAENLKKELPELYKNSGLPEAPDELKINELLIKLRKEFYE